jgi:hypothetical protein
VAAGQLEESREHHAAGKRQRQESEVERDLAHGGAAEGPRDDPSDQGRLEEDQHRGGRAEAGVEPEQVAHRPGAANEACVEGTH